MSQIKCPYCGSIQVKAMANQPKKYPRPSEPLELEKWQRGYDCKKCGNDFVITPSKPTSFITKLLGWIFLLIIAFIVYAAFISPSMDDKPITKNEEKSQVIDNAPENTSMPETIEDPLKQEFSKEAEEAAHAYIPQLEETKQKSIADSQDQSDTLSIKTTIREAE